MLSEARMDLFEANTLIDIAKLVFGDGSYNNWRRMLIINNLVVCQASSSRFLLLSFSYYFLFLFHLCTSATLGNAAMNTISQIIVSILRHDERG